MNKQQESQSKPKQQRKTGRNRVPRRKVLSSPYATMAGLAKCDDLPHTLMTDELRQRLPKLYATQNLVDPIVQVRYTAWDVCDWNVIEFDGRDMFFGFAWRAFPVWGYFRLSDLELMNAWHQDGAIVADRLFEPKPTSLAVLDYCYDV
jgi:hypothetical protein